MEELLKEMLAELKYQTKLLEGIYESADSSKIQGMADAKSQKNEILNQYKMGMKAILEHPSFSKNPEMKKLFENLVNIGG